MLEENESVTFDLSVFTHNSDMFVLKTLIEKYTQNNPKVLFSCFIDLRKAFDKVRHDGLLYKLRKNGISDHFLQY
jgi:hypothetical protein